ncbi:hypothetical protein F5Y16DRAFT_363569 [Xylariaceae sp. FL0255]|nr:hypothetical protein F5Y16DRAFT_363569 [Xylariaceae sp. FL0255]
MVASIGGIWAPLALRLARSTAYRATKLLRSTLQNAARPVNTTLEPAYIRNTNRQPIHPTALLRQQKSRRWNNAHSFSTKNTYYHNIDAAVRRFFSTGRFDAAHSISRADLAKFRGTQVGRAVSQLPGRAPFASTLRPNLTGGALPRSSGGYGFGTGRSGARYFSHAPAPQAQVIQNVSAAVRAFWISGQKAQFDGYSPRGEKQYRAVSAMQEECSRKMASVPRHAAGSFIDFRLNPTITSLSPLAGAFPFPSAAFPAEEIKALVTTTLNTDGFLDVLSVDFARALQDLTATLADIKKLSALGDLPIQLEKGYILRVRFPGVDAETVESLCDDLGLTRGIVHEDPDFDAEVGVPMALKFPYAPESRITSPGGSLRSEDSFPREEELFGHFSVIEEMNPWLSSLDLEGYESMSPPFSSGEHCSEDFEGLQGVYRFIEECDRAEGRYVGVH